MAKTTQLYQRARSPLIQGHSKVERPWIVDVMKGTLIGLPLPFLFALAAATAGGQTVGQAFQSLAPRLVFIVLAGAGAAFVGAASGVSVARSWGSRRPWVVGAFAAVAVTLIAWALLGGVITG